MSGRLVHFEIPFDDGERARAFYREAFGWSLMTMPEMDYTMVSTGPSSEEGGPSEPGYIGGGMLQRSAAQQSPVVVVDVDDIDAALKKIEGLGGKTVVSRQPVGEMGFSAYFTDTEGNLTGLWQTTPQAG